MAKRGRANTAFRLQSGARLQPNVRAEELRNAHAGGPRQCQLPKLSVLPQNAIRNNGVQSAGTEKLHWGIRTFRGERIPFAKFIDIVYIPWFHCTVGCRVTAARGTGKPIHVVQKRFMRRRTASITAE